MEAGMSVRISTAVAYFGGRRRWFSAKSAAKAEASHVINRLCYCEKHSGDREYSPEVCRLHADPARLERLRAWLYVRALHYMIDERIGDQK